MCLVAVESIIHELWDDDNRQWEDTAQDWASMAMELKVECLWAKN